LVPVIGLVKPRTERRRSDREATDRVVLPGVKNALHLPPHGGPLRLLQAIRDESHRTAVRFHRKTRRTRTLRSRLDEVEGIGETRRRALLAWFGSLAAVRSASAAQIAEVPGFGPKLAEQLVGALGVAPSE
jgi:excinuclease ABC subunit C